MFIWRNLQRQGSTLRYGRSAQKNLALLRMNAGQKPHTFIFKKRGKGREKLLANETQLIMLYSTQLSRKS